MYWFILIRYIFKVKGATLFITFEPIARVIGKKEELHDKKDEEQFDEYDQPNGFPPGHVAEPISIEVIDF